MPKFWEPSENYQPTPFAQILLRIMRDNWPLTPTQLAHQMHMSPFMVTNYLRGSLPRDHRVLEKIHTTYGVPLADLYTAAGFYPLLPPPAPNYEVAAPPVPPGDQWDDAIWRVQQMRVPPEVRETLIRMLENSRSGFDPNRRHIVAEHTVEAAGEGLDSPTLPTFPVLPSMPTLPPMPEPAQPAQEQPPERTERHVRQQQRASRRATAEPARVSARMTAPGGESPEKVRRPVRKR